jgi:hypothetical protein
MGRPLLGKEKRTEIISIRITGEQRKELERVYGNGNRGMHAIFIAWLAQRK